MPDTVLITGASSGIGREFAHVFASHGARLLLTARNAEQLAEVAELQRQRFGIEALVFPEDLATPDGPKRLFEAVSEAGESPDVLVNNAGMGCYGLFDPMPLEQQMDMLRVNVTALTELSWRFMQAMRRRNAGRILNVASTAAFYPGPHMAAYYASKAYILSLSESLREETRKSNLTITCLCPGPTDTPFVNRTGVGGTWLFRQPMQAQEVASVGYQALYAGRPLVVPGWRNKLFAFLPRIMPRSWSRRAVRKLQAFPKETRH